MWYIFGTTAVVRESGSKLNYALLENKLTRESQQFRVFLSLINTPVEHFRTVFTNIDSTFKMFTSSAFATPYNHGRFERNENRLWRMAQWTCSHLLNAEWTASGIIASRWICHAVIWGRTFSYNIEQTRTTKATYSFEYLNQLIRPLNAMTFTWKYRRDWGRHI
jgi:hypothetical protein